MTAEQFDAALKTLGLNDTQAAGLLRYGGKNPRQQVYRMRRGLRPVLADKAAMVQSWMDGYRPADWPLER